MIAMTPIDDEQLERTLLALEQDGWRALSSDRGARYFREALTEHPLLVFPGTVLSKDRALEEIAAAPPWAEFRIEEPRVVRLTEQSAVLTYRATARREDGPEYHALMSSVYVASGGSWRMAFHQQTPLPAPG
ncbi:MAG: DUF4440 domain-containing protein [Acidimicrobiia bacterium]